MEAPWVSCQCNELEKCTLQWYSGGGQHGETVLLEARGKHVAAIKVQADRGMGWEFQLLWKLVKTVWSH